jgi:hypothetical protein
MYLDNVKPDDREQVIRLQKDSGCQFPIPNPLNGFVIRDSDDGHLIAWAGWEPVAEILGAADPSLSTKEKMRVWINLHKAVEAEVVRHGITVGYVQIKQEHRKFAAILNYLGWKFCPGYWLRREAGSSLSRLNPVE